MEWLIIVLMVCIGGCFFVKGCDDSAENERIERIEKERSEIEKEQWRLGLESLNRQQEAELRNCRQELERQRAECKRERIARENAEQKCIAHENAERERIAHERAERERVKREYSENDQKRMDRLRDYASTLDSRIWQTWYTLGAVVDSKRKSIDKLRKEVKLFGRNPDEDDSVKRLAAELEGIASAKERFLKTLEEAYLQSRDPIPAEERSRKQLEFREELLRMAKEIESFY